LSVTGHVVALCVANALMLGVGAGLLPVLHLAETPRELLLRLPLAYAIGLAAAGVVAAELALVDVPVGRVGLPLLAAVTLTVGLRRLARPRPIIASGTPFAHILPAFAILLVIAAYLANAARLLT